MKVWATFHGGYNYGESWIPFLVKDVEEFDSLQSAKDTFWRRCDFDPYYPCTDESAEMQVFLANPINEDDQPNDYFADVYPDRIITVGPRGGIRCSRC